MRMPILTTNTQRWEGGVTAAGHEGLAPQGCGLGKKIACGAAVAACAAACVSGVGTAICASCFAAIGAGSCIDCA
jgi:hypothetical protein